MGSASAARAHQPIVLQATLKGRVLHVAGRNFAPGTRVALATIDTETWQTVSKGSTMSEPAIYQCRKGAGDACGTQDPLAGEISFEEVLPSKADKADLAVFYHSGAEIGVSQVRAK
jgi:hypothetical protein